MQRRWKKLWSKRNKGGGCVQDWKRGKIISSITDLSRSDPPPSSKKTKKAEDKWDGKI